MLRENSITCKIPTHDEKADFATVSGVMFRDWLGSERSVKASAERDVVD